MDEQPSVSWKTTTEKADLYFFQFKMKVLSDPTYLTSEQIKWAKGDHLLAKERGTLTIEDMSKFTDYVCMRMSAESPDVIKEFVDNFGIDESWQVEPCVDSCTLGGICALLLALELSETYSIFCETLRRKIEDFFKV